jgi:WD40 repeat protein
MLELRAGGAPVTAVAFSPSGRFLVTGDAKRAVRIWAVSTGRALPEGFDWDAEFDRDGSVLGAGYGGIVSWSPSGDGKLRRRNRAGTQGYGADVAPEGRTVAFLEWRRRTRVVVRSIDGGTRQAFRADSFVLSDDGERVLLLGARPRLVDVTGNADTVRFGKFKRLRSSAVSRDHRKVLLAGRLFDVGDPRRPVELEGRAGHGGAFSPDARRVLTAGRDVRIWDTATGKRLGVLEDHVGGVVSARWSPDGTLIVTGGADRTVRIWDGTTFRLLGVVEGFPDPVIDAKLDRDGRRLLTRTLFSAPRVVQCTPCVRADELAELARRNVTRDLTAKERADAGLTR